MSSEDAIEYCRQRAAEERELAITSGRVRVAALHQELARQYQALANRAEFAANTSMRRSGASDKARMENPSQR
jgi:hypothetical protein